MNNHNIASNRAKLKNASSLLIGLMLMVFSSIAAAEKKRIMVLGDSNSWGWIPVGNIVPTSRYSEKIRWPNVMAQQLGDDFTVITEALSGRSTVSDDDSLGIMGAGMNGMEYLPAALASHMPLDLVVIMLGTNDTKVALNQSPLDISLGVMQLVSEVQKNTGVLTTYNPAKVLVVAPPALGKIAEVDWLQEIFDDTSVQKSTQIASILGPLTAAINVPFFDAGTVVKIQGVDGIHLLPDAHKTLGLAVAKQVSGVFK